MPYSSQSFGREARTGTPPRAWSGGRPYRTPRTGERRQAVRQGRRCRRAPPGCAGARGPLCPGDSRASPGVTGAALPYRLAAVHHAVADRRDVAGRSRTRPAPFRRAEHVADGRAVVPYRHGGGRLRAEYHGLPEALRLRHGLADVQVMAPGRRLRAPVQSVNLRELLPALMTSMFTAAPAPLHRAQVLVLGQVPDRRLERVAPERLGEHLLAALDHRVDDRGLAALHRLAPPRPSRPRSSPP